MLITLKAKFEDGSVEFLDQVPFDGNCDLLVTFLTHPTNTSSKHSEQQDEIVNHFRETLLTHREVEVLKNMQKGLTNKEIAWTLRLGEGTVRNYLSSIYKKLKARNRAETIQKALELGIIDPPESKW